jgi:hypothetical protein
MNLGPPVVSIMRSPHRERKPQTRKPGETSRNVVPRLARLFYPCGNAVWVSPLRLPFNCLPSTTKPTSLLKARRPTYTSAKIRLATFDALGELGHSKGVIGEEHEGPPPCSGRLLLLPPPDCRRSDARSGMARTSPTSDARRVSSRSVRGVPPSRGVALQG